MFLLGKPIEDVKVRQREEQCAINLLPKIKWKLFRQDFPDIKHLNDSQLKSVIAFTLWAMAIEDAPDYDTLDKGIEGIITKVYSNDEYSHICKWIGDKPEVEYVVKLLKSVNAFDIGFLWEINGSVFGSSYRQREMWVKLVNKNLIPAFKINRSGWGLLSATKPEPYHTPYSAIKDKPEESMLSIKG